LTLPRSGCSERAEEQFPPRRSEGFFMKQVSAPLAERPVYHPLLLDRR
jgi:hypothetical protein